MTQDYHWPPRGSETWQTADEILPHPLGECSECKGYVPESETREMSQSTWDDAERRVEAMFRGSGRNTEHVEHGKGGALDVELKPTDPVEKQVCDILESEVILAKSELKDRVKDPQDRFMQAIRDLKESGDILPDPTGDPFDPKYRIPIGEEREPEQEPEPESEADRPGPDEIEALATTIMKDSEVFVDPDTLVGLEDYR